MSSQGHDDLISYENKPWHIVDIDTGNVSLR